MPESVAIPSGLQERYQHTFTELGQIPEGGRLRYCSLVVSSSAYRELVSLARQEEPVLSCGGGLVLGLDSIRILLRKG